MTLSGAERIVIVGAGLAGGNAAVTLRTSGFDGELVLYGDEATIPYGRPPLSKTYLRGEESLDDWYVKPVDWYADHDVEFRGNTRVSRIDVDAKRVITDDGENSTYDRLALCSGGRPRRPHLPGIDLSGVHVLRTIADCDALKRVARPDARAVVVGMGFIGSEVAASMRQLGVTVTAVHGGGAPLEAVLGKEVGDVIGGVHAEHGVELVPNDQVVRFEGTDSLERVTTRGGRTIDCDFAVVGAGIEPNVECVMGTPVALDNGVLVDARCRSNLDGLFAAGDVANHLHPLFGRVRVEHYNNAEKMGAAVARSLLGDTDPYDYVHTFWSDQFEHKLEYVGHAREWDDFVVRGSTTERRFLGFYLKGGALKAVVGLNRGGDPELEPDDELGVCRQLVAAQASPSRDILADERVDLHSLL